MSPPPRYEENAPPQYEQDDPPPAYTVDCHPAPRQSRRLHSRGNASSEEADIDREVQALYGAALGFLYPSTRRTRATPPTRRLFPDSAIDLESGRNELPERPEKVKKKKKLGRWRTIAIFLVIIIIVVPIVVCKILQVGTFAEFDDTNYVGVRPGTSLAAISQPYTDNARYGVVYQMATGRLRLSIHAQTDDTWNIVSIPASAIDGTPLATSIHTNALAYPDADFEPFVLSLFYVAQNGTLQELSLSQDQQIWTSGSLGKTAFNASIDPMSHLAVGSTGHSDVANSICGAGTRPKWLMYQPQGQSFIQELLWDQSTDEWHPGARIHGLDPYSGFATLFTQQEGDYLFAEPRFTKWFFGIGTDGRIKTWKCHNCCGGGSSSGNWTLEDNHPAFAPFSTSIPPNTTMAAQDWANSDTPMVFVHRAAPDANHGIYTMGSSKPDNTALMEDIGKKSVYPGSKLALATDGTWAVEVFYQVRSDARIRGHPVNKIDGDPVLGNVPVRPVNW